MAFKNTENRNIAAIKIQSAWRNYRYRRFFDLPQLPHEKQTDYKTFVTGNDPKIAGLPHHAKGESVALIGTSGFKSIELACQLSDDPAKLVIVDNSCKVVEFWRKARILAIQSTEKTEFLKRLCQHITSSDTCRNGLERHSIQYVSGLINEYGFDKVTKIILGTTILAETWANRDTLLKINARLHHLGFKHIYVYPSNIVAYLHKFDNPAQAQQVLKNIAEINPKLAIHSDFCETCYRPEFVFFINDHDPLQVSRQLRITPPPQQVISRSRKIYPFFKHWISNMVANRATRNTNNETELHLIQSDVSITEQQKLPLQ